MLFSNCRATSADQVLGCLSLPNLELAVVDEVTQQQHCLTAHDKAPNHNSTKLLVVDFLNDRKFLVHSCQGLHLSRISSCKHRSLFSPSWILRNLDENDYLSRSANSVPRSFIYLALPPVSPNFVLSSANTSLVRFCFSSQYGGSFLNPFSAVFTQS